jgi:hypothetical protein
VLSVFGQEGAQFKDFAASDTRLTIRPLVLYGVLSRTPYFYTPHVRIQRIILKYHGDIAVFRWNGGYQFVADKIARRR